MRVSVCTGHAQRRRVGQAEVAGGGGGIDQDARLVAAGDRFDQKPGAGVRHRAGFGVDIRPVIEAAADATDFLRVDQSVQGLVDGLARPEIIEIRRRPDAAKCHEAHSPDDRRLEIESRAPHRCPFCQEHV